MNYPNNNIVKNNLHVTSHKHDYISKTTNPAVNTYTYPIQHPHQFKLTKLFFGIKIEKKFFQKYCLICHFCC